MTDRPIIFSAPMVRALLDGRKTMTRRLMKRGIVREWLDAGFSLDFINDPGNASALPYQPGDRLWVRENCWTESRMNEGDGVRYPADGEWRVIRNTPEASEAWCAMDRYAHARQPCNDTNTGQLVPSIHMPRWASRITLTVTAVRVERLQEISTDDALAEGCGLRDGMHHLALRIAEFRDLWNSLHGPGAWDANPEVVALSFTVAKENIDHGR